MTCYWVQPRNIIFVKDYAFFSFARNVGKNVGKNISINFSSKYCQKLFDHAKQTATDALNTASKKVIQKNAAATGDLFGNKVVHKIKKVSKTSPKNNSKTNEEKKS